MLKAQRTHLSFQRGSFEWFLFKLFPFSIYLIHRRKQDVLVDKMFFEVFYFRMYHFMTILLSKHKKKSEPGRGKQYCMREEKN